MGVMPLVVLALGAATTTEASRLQCTDKVKENMRKVGGGAG